MAQLGAAGGALATEEEPPVELDFHILNIFWGKLAPERWCMLGLHRYIKKNQELTLVIFGG